MQKQIILFTIFLCTLLTTTSISAQDKADSATSKKATEELPLEPERNISFTTEEGTWISLDVSPDGSTIAFDLMGDIYTLPITGGKAKRITEGMAYDVHPRYSPDGKTLAFISDKSGADNIWTRDLDTGKETQITEDENQYFFSAEWTPDGDYLVGARGRQYIKLHLYPKEGGSGSQLIDGPRELKMIDPAFGADGKLLYFSKRKKGWDYNAQLPQYQIGTYDMEDGDEAVITSRYGSAFTPTFSPDGNLMVYGSRFEEHTGLVVRDLNTGDEKWLAYPVQRDEQESLASLGVLPAMSFTPDSQKLIASYGGKMYAIALDDSGAQEIPFSVDIDLDMGPRLEFKYPISDEGEALATQIRDAVPSPDGTKLAFSALSRLYIMDIPNGTPKRLTDADRVEAHPAWSPDGQHIVFTTWEKEGGHLYKADATGRKTPLRLTQQAGIYTHPKWAYRSDRIAFHRGSAQNYKNLISATNANLYEDLMWISPEGGELHYIDKTKSRQRPHFTKTDDRVYLSHADKGLISIRWDGTDEKEHLKLEGILPFGAGFMMDDHSKLTADKAEDDDSKDKATKPSLVQISPDGKSAMAKVNNDIYVSDLPGYGKTPVISLAKPEEAAFPVTKLTIMGGEFPSWSSDNKNIHWSLGASHFIYDLAKGKKYTDSIAELKKEKLEEVLEKADVKTDSTLTADNVENTDEFPKFKAQEFKVEVKFQKAMPKGTVLLSGGRIITMKGDEIIEKGDVLIENNRIRAVGPSGSLSVPFGTKTIDVAGKTVIPGFVDTHAHMWPKWNLHSSQFWMYANNFAYGLTTTRDPQTMTTDVLTYADMVESGAMVGPRIYHTGPGVAFWSYNLKSLEHTKEILRQYSDYYDTKTLKMYVVGNRQQRQWVVEACRELKLMPTTEGGLDFKLNMTQMVDGYPGQEHALPIYPIYSDVVKIAAESKMAISSTLLLAYGGPLAENYYYATEDVYNDKKLAYFTPYDDLALRTRRRPAWFMEEEHIFKKHGEFMKDLVEAGGLAGIGSHGQLQGLGYHWELWSVASGGMKNHDALKTATLLGATALGLDGDLGSLEVGKLADILILEKNPLDNLRNTNTILNVIKNGTIYDAATLDEVWPEEKKAEPFDWQSEKPEGLPGIKK